LFQDNWSTGLGWDGITVAVLGNNNPWGVLAAAIFFGALRAGGLQMQRIAGVPLEMVRVIQGFIVLFIAAPKAINWLSDRGVNYATWLKTDRIPAFLHLLTSGMAGVSTIYTFVQFGAFASIIEASVPGTGGILTILLLLTSIISMYALVELLGRKQQGLTLVLFAAVEWLIIAMMGYVAGSMFIVGTSLFVGGAIIVLVVIVGRVFPETVVEEGGEN
jgi:hypothetical protein